MEILGSEVGGTQVGKTFAKQMKTCEDPFQTCEDKGLTQFVAKLADSHWQAATGYSSGEMFVSNSFGLERAEGHFPLPGEVAGHGQC